MPRDLTDLMERATSFAPPEPHEAPEITRLASQRHRRRTTTVAAGLAVAVVALGGFGYGVTRGSDTKPEPLAPYKYGQTVDLSAAVPASTLPGYHVIPWTTPSVQRFGPSSDKAPAPTYWYVDAQGRLIVVDLPNGHGPGERPSGPVRARLFDHPGQPPQPVQPPTPDAGDQGWIPSFLDDGRLLWTDPMGNRSGFYVTDLDGGHGVFVRDRDGMPGMGNGTAGWVSGDHYWFTVVDDVGYQTTDQPLLSHSLYRSTLSGDVTKLADHVSYADVHDGVAAWVTTDGRVFTESGTGSPREVDVPLDDGCSLTPPSKLNQNMLFVADRSVIGLTERCAPADELGDEFIAFDLDGHRLVHVTGVTAVRMSLGHDALILLGLDPRNFDVEQLRYDLRTGTLSRLSAPSQKRYSDAPVAAGDYVLWYDEKGGHVARIPQ